MALLVALPIYAGVRVTDIEGVTTVRGDAAAREVYVAVGGLVFVTDESGQTRRVLRAERLLEAISDVARLPDGGYAIAEGGRQRLHLFDPAGEKTGEIHAPQYFTRTFEIEPLASGGFVVADTIGDRLLVIDSALELEAEARCGYPNGLLRWAPGLLAVQCTRTSDLMLFDESLSPVDPPKNGALASAVNAPLEGLPGWELGRGPGGELYRDVCRTNFDECAVLRMEPHGADWTPVASLRGWRLPTTDWSRELREQGGVWVTSQGAVLVSSDRFTGVFEFSDGIGRTPGALGGSQEALTDSALTGGAIVGDDNHVRRFGDATLREAIDSVLDSRTTMARVELAGQIGLYVLLGLLLLWYGLDRMFSNGDRDQGVLKALGQRAQTVVDELVSPEAALLGAYVTAALLAFVGGAVAGYLVAGASTALLVGLGASRVIARRFAGPLLVDRRSPSLAAHAVELQVGARAAHVSVLEPGERVLAAGYRLPLEDEDEERYREFASDLVDLPEDPTDILDLVAPTLQMVAVTDRRALRYSCDLVGRPRGPIHVSPRGSSGAAVLCQRCGRAVTASSRCSHQRLSTKPAHALGALLPGAGHLLLGEFGRGRFLLMVFAALALDLAALLLFRHYGTLPVSAQAVYGAAGSAAALWAFAHYDLWRIARVRRQEGVELPAFDTSHGPGAAEADHGLQVDVSEAVVRLGRARDWQAVAQLYRAEIAKPEPPSFAERALAAVVRAATETQDAALLVAVVRALMSSYPASDFLPGALWHVAAAQKREGRDDLATKTLNTLIQRHPGDPFAVKARAALGDEGE